MMIAFLDTEAWCGVLLQPHHCLKLCFGALLRFVFSVSVSEGPILPCPDSYPLSVCAVSVSVPSSISIKIEHDVVGCWMFKCI